MPASRIPESCTPIWKRRMKMSLLPGRIAYRPPNVVRPNVMTSVTTQITRRARPAGNERQRAMQKPIPTATRIVTMGQRPSS